MLTAMELYHKHTIMKQNILFLSLILFHLFAYHSTKGQTGVTRVGSNTSNSGRYNSLFGYYAGNSINSGGSYNTFMGAETGKSTFSGGYNTFLGGRAGYRNTTGSNNVFVGRGAGNYNTTGFKNTYIGTSAGYENKGSGNVFIGYRAGYWEETTSNTLIISNDEYEYELPLIYGNFSTKQLKIGGSLHVNGSIKGNQDGALRIDSGHGYLEVGAKNEFHAHFHTDRTDFYFNKRINVDEGIISSYNENLQLQTRGTTRMLLNQSNGYVGIGTTSPAYKLDVFGDIRTTSSLKLSGTGTIFESTNSGVQTFKFTNDNLIGINLIEIADPGENEGIAWTGTGAKIFVSPLNGGGTDGFLRVINDGGISFEGGSEGREDLLIAANGHVGIGTTSPDHPLSVIGRIHAAHTEATEATQAIQLWHTAQEGNIGTSSGTLRIRQNNTDYLSINKAGAGAVIDAMERNLVLKNNGGEALTIDQEGDVLINQDMKVTGNLKLNTNFLNADPQQDKILNVQPDGTLTYRSAETLTPWVVREVLGTDGLPEHVITCDTTLGHSCGCGPSIVSQLGLYDMNGNIKIGNGAYIDNDTLAGNNGTADDWIRLNESVQFSSSSQTKGLVLWDRDMQADHFLNLHQIGGVSYFTNSNTSGTPQQQYFMKANLDRSVEFASDLSVKDLRPDTISHTGDLVMALNTDEQNNDGSFIVGAGNPEDGVSWKEYLQVKPNGDAVFSPDIRNTQNHPYVKVEGSSGSAFLTGSIGLGNTANAPNITWDGPSGNGWIHRALAVGDTSAAHVKLHGDTGSAFLTGALHLGNTTAPSITWDGISGNGGLKGVLTVGDPGTTHVILDGGTGNASVSGNATIGGTLHTAGISTFDQAVNVSGSLNVLGSSDIHTYTYGKASQWYQAYDAVTTPGNGLQWDSSTKTLSVKTGHGLYFQNGAVHSYFVKDGSNQLSYSGSLAIGTTTHSDYALAVAGEIGAEEVTILAQSAWPDYVFEQDYALQSLQETEAFIAKNKHLPDVPSAGEVADNGIKVGEMQAVLLKKIEELTLHLIKKDKEIEALKQANQRFASIESRLSKLESEK